MNSSGGDSMYLQVLSILGLEDVDINYLTWLWWLVSPLLAVFLLPGLILVMLYISSLVLVISRHHRRKIIQALHKDPWHGCQNLACAIWEATSRIWHGYEVTGIENIPEDGGALLIFYHGATPIDIYYLVAKLVLYKNRLARTVGDRFVFQIPGWGPILEAFKVIPGTVQSCTEIVKDGHLLAIAPGGVYEALLGDHYYELLWKQRTGFAKVALQANVPIVPIFTANIREAFRSVSLLKSMWRWLYSLTKLPLVPIYGGFPVKLRTYVGEPIMPDPGMEPAELASKVHFSADSGLILSTSVFALQRFRGRRQRFSRITDLLTDQVRASLQDAAALPLQPRRK